MTLTYNVDSTEQTETVGRELAERLERSSRCTFIAMRGEMGVGKTAFTRGFASYFGIKGVKSPTYTVVNEYHGTKNIYHFDFYRLADADDLYSIGYDDIIERRGYFIAEWSERIPEYIPEMSVTVTISRVCSDMDYSGGEQKRIITIDIPYED